MNDWNSVEKQLRSWRPRPPSDRVENAIFGRPAPERPRKTGLLTHLQWQNGWAAGMATFAILLITCVNLIHVQAGSGVAPWKMAAAISNASYAASFAEVQHNCVTAPIFGWTNDRELHSSMPSLDLLKTNYLR